MAYNNNKNGTSLDPFTQNLTEIKMKDLHKKWKSLKGTFIL